MTAPEAAEEWLARRCDDFARRVNGVYAAVFSGVTDTAQRRERMREAIREGYHDHIIAGRRADGKIEVFSGVTDTETRKARMREAIRSRGLAEAICGKRGEKVETFRAVYQRVYGEAL